MKAIARNILNLIELISLYLLGQKFFYRRVKQDEYWQKRLENDFIVNANLINQDSYYDRFDKEIISLLGSDPDAVDFLEIGCYYGHRTNILAWNFPTKKFTGTDLNAKNIAFGIEHLNMASNLQLSEANAIALPFSDNSFDTVYTIVSVSHMSHDIVVLALQEMARVCRKNVILIEVDLFAWPLKKQLSTVGMNYMFFHDYLSVAPFSLEIQRVVRLHCGETVPRYSVFIFSKKG